MTEFICRLGTPSGEIVTRVIEASGAGEAKSRTSAQRSFRLQYQEEERPRDQPLGLEEVQNVRRRGVYGRATTFITSGHHGFRLSLAQEQKTRRPGIALALFMLALPVFTFVLSPLSALYSRKHEFEADVFASQNASATSLTQALVKLYEDNAATLTPDPLHSAFYDSHPPAAIRIARLEALGGAAAPAPA